jgi:hypothetical protein
MDNNLNNNNESIRLANTWAGRRVTISGVGGTICMGPPLNEDDEKKKQKKTNGGPRIVKTSHGTLGLHLLIERAPDALKIPGAVAFRVVLPPTATTGATKNNEPSSMYLTNIMYGDELRQSTAEMMAAIPSLLADHIPLIVDFSIGRPTGETNFEGAGFNYSPMTIQKAGSAAGPNKLQVFTLECRDGGGRFGVKSLFGTYWRSQHWDQIVSQSPHCLGDETWNISAANDEEGKQEKTPKRWLRGRRRNRNI